MNLKDYSGAIAEQIKQLKIELILESQAFKRVSNEKKRLECVLKALR